MRNVAELVELVGTTKNKNMQSIMVKHNSESSRKSREQILTQDDAIKSMLKMSQNVPFIYQEIVQGGSAATPTKRKLGPKFLVTSLVK